MGNDGEHDFSAVFFAHIDELIDFLRLQRAFPHEDIIDTNRYVDGLVLLRNGGKLSEQEQENRRRESFHGLATRNGMIPCFPVIDKGGF
jgi:hypothetical protein